MPLRFEAWRIIDRALRGPADAPLPGVADTTARARARGGR